MAAFISQSDLSAYLRRDLTSETALAAIALDSASEVVRSYTNLTLDATASDTVTLDGSGTQVLWLPESPVTAVASVTLYSGGDSEELLVEGIDNDYVWHEAGRLYRPDGVCWPSEPQSVTVVYSYGNSTIPADIRLVALQVAARVFALGPVVTESAGGYSATYATDAMGGLSPSEMRVLDRHRIEDWNA